MRPRILAVDDEREWLDNFKAWIPNDIAEQDSAIDTQTAIEFLRRYRYHSVLLDLSMSSDRLDRSTRSIQDYLATRPEGTAYLVVSGTIRKEEVKKSAYSLNAFDVIFKEEISPTGLKERVIDAIEQGARQDSNLITQTVHTFVGDLHQQDVILRALDPGGAQGLYEAVTSFARKLAPVAQHRDRPPFAILRNIGVGLVWSRQVGTAVSIAMANHMTSETEVMDSLAQWLGYSEREPLFSIESRNVRTLCFNEANISDTHFKLPDIS